MAGFIPLRNSERTIWAKTFKWQFAESAAEYGFDAADVAKVEAACDTIGFAVTLANLAKIYSKACVKYRDGVLKSKNRQKHTVPVFTMPAAPPALLDADAVGYLQEIARILKTRSNYTSAIGARLGILTASQAQVSLDDATAKGKVLSLLNSVVRIDWRKGKSQGVIVQSKRGDEQNWTELGRDFFSPFIDTRPPLEHGKPEIRYYRIIYLLEDKPVGNYSPIYTAITIP